VAMKSRRLRLAAIAAFVLLVAFQSGAVIGQRRLPREGTSDGAPVVDSGPVKVGVIVSRTTAKGANFAGTTQGYKHAAIAAQLRDKETELYAVIDPDSEKDPDLVKTLHRYFPENRVIN